MEKNIDGVLTQTDRDMDDFKRSISSRIIQLKGKRSIRKTAKDWGIAVGALNSYLYKGSMPSIDKVFSIANAEGVSVEWIATGYNDCDQGHQIKAHSSIEDHNLSMSDTSSERSQLVNDWLNLCKDLSDDDLRKLKQAIVNRGIKGILISERANSIGVLADQLPEESYKEISILLNYAQYCALTGREFKASVITEELKKAAG